MLIPNPLNKRILIIETKKWTTNARFKGEKLNASLSASLADLQSVKQTNVSLMKERKKWTANAIFKGENLSASLSVSLADPQSAKQTNVILMKERNGQPNARF